MIPASCVVPYQSQSVRLHHIWFLSLVSDTELLKPLQYPDKGDRSAFCYNEVSRESPWIASGWGLVIRRNKTHQKFRTFSSTLESSKFPLMWSIIPTKWNLHKTHQWILSWFHLSECIHVFGGWHTWKEHEILKSCYPSGLEFHTYSFTCLLSHSATCFL